MTKILEIIPRHQSWLLSFTIALTLILLLRSHLSGAGDFSAVEHQSPPPPKKNPSKGPNSPPVMAYWILGYGGESKRVLRLLKAIYHPRNQYLVQLDSSSSDRERIELGYSVRSEKVFREFGNVDVVGKGYGVSDTAASGLAAVLHAAAVMLRIGGDWDWFVPLSTSDYPLLNQDDILYGFASLPKHVNFMSYANDTTSWEKRQNVSKIVVDPNIYFKRKTQIFYAAETRAKPDAFEIFGGSPWMVLSKAFLDHCVHGLDNLPRKLLMYMNNVAFPLESYFQTVICNTPEFQNMTIVNNDLRHYIVQKTSNKQNHHQHIQTSTEAIFIRPLKEHDLELQEIDKKLLDRDPNRIVPGKWCTGMESTNDVATSNEDTCSTWGDINVIQSSDRGVKLRNFLLRIGEKNKFASTMCQNYVTNK